MLNLHDFRFVGVAIADENEWEGANEDTFNKEKAKANKFIEEIKRMNKSMDIPDKIKGIVDSDIPKLAKQAMSEANPLYPVPKIMLIQDFISIYEMIKE